MAVRTTVIAGTAAVVGGTIASKNAAAAAPAPAPVEAPPVAQAPVAAAPAELSVIEQLTQLAGLKDAGVLTDAEFDAQKAKLLAQ